MKVILTRQGQSILVDDDDYPVLSKFIWGVDTRGYVRRNIRADGKRVRQITIHRQLLGLDPSDRRIVDHINGIKTDNRHCNLRVCTKSQNGANRGHQRNNSAGYKGVTFHKGTGRFIAQIQKDGRKIHLGSYDSAERAHAAYRSAAESLQGEFARAVPFQNAAHAAQTGESKC